jgi:hypothetical protein
MTATIGRKPIIVSGLMLLAAVGPILWLYAGGAEHPIYWLLVNYLIIACGTGIIAFGMLGWLASRVVVVPYGRFAIIMLLLACIASAFGSFLGWWGAPEHNDSVQAGDNVYHVAVDPLHDVSNFYYLYECDGLGLTCTRVWESTTCSDCSLDLTVNNDGSVVNILEGTEIIATYEPPD